LSGDSNPIQGNLIFANGGLGIDLGGDGVTTNDEGDFDTGANELTNFPVLTRVASFDGQTFVVGSLSSTRNTSFTLEFFSSPAADDSGFGEGQFLLGTATVLTDITGHADFDVSLADSTAPGSFVTATASDQNANTTSEFSAAIQVPLPALVNAPVLTRVGS